jgi:hypothetical protein
MLAQYDLGMLLWYSQRQKLGSAYQNEHPKTRYESRIVLVRTHSQAQRFFLTFTEGATLLLPPRCVHS